MKAKSKVKLTGSKKAGWIINISDNIGYIDDLAITNDEAKILLSLLKKKLKDALL